MLASKESAMDTVQRDLSSVDWDFPFSNKMESLHSIHSYPARFVPEIPRTLIEILGVLPGTSVLDPFCGSGVTLVEAQRAGYPSVGIDLNPIACLISRVKTHFVHPDLLDHARRVVEEAKNLLNEPLAPTIPNLDHWFERNVQEAVTKLLWGIEYVARNDTIDGLHLALSSILVKVSNQDSDTRYAAVLRNTTSNEVYKQFISAAERILLAKEKITYPPTETLVLHRNILDVQKSDVPHRVGLVVTSPPYPNAYEYWLYHKYRMFWLGYDPQEVKKHEIGARAHYFRKSPPTDEDFRMQILYLFNLFNSVVVEGGHVCVVVGRSKIHGRIVNNAELVSKVAEDTGFEVLATIPRRIASTRKSFNLSHARIKTEHLLVFRKNH